MTGFLVEYHRPTGNWSVQEFSGAQGIDEALAENARLEQCRVSTDFEIAVLTTDSLATLRRTHSRYFSGVEQTPGFSSVATALI